MSATALRSPYKGLAPFEDSEQDALFFFGRERESEVVVANMLASKLTVLYGPSGVGKSSMLRAAVARRLRELAPEAEVAVLDVWAGEPALPRPDGETYLILDQFEEYFLYHGEGPLLDELPELLAQPRVHVLISLRDDALSRLDAFQARIPNVFANRLSIDHLDRDSARAAIVGPIDRWNELVPSAERAGIEAALVTTVLDEVAAAPGGNGSGAAGRIEAPYLQLVMERVWEEEHAAGSSFLRLATLERLGGARAIVSMHLERTLGTLTPHDAAIAASALTFLVTPTRSKIAQSFDDLVGYTDEPPAELRGVLDLLAAQRILRVASVNGDGAGRRYEIFHDVLAEPVLSWRRGFVAAAALEAERETAARRNRRLLFIAVGAGVIAAAMIALAAYAISQKNEASKQQQQAEKQTQRARRAALLATNAQKHAETSAHAARHAEQKEKQAENAANASAATSEQETKKAQQAQQTTAVALAAEKTQRQRADSAAARARRQKGIAHNQARLYQQEAKINKIGELVARSQAQLTVDPVKSVQAALQASDSAATADVEDSLRNSLQQLRVRAILDGGGGPVNAAIFSHDGSLVATGAGGGPTSARSTSAVRGGTLRIFRTTTHALVESQKLGAVITTAAFAPDDKTIAVGTADGTTVLYDVTTKKLLQTFHDDAGVLDVAFADGGSEVLTGSSDKTFRIWDAASGSLVRTIAGTRPVQTIAMSTDGLLAATVQTGDPVIRVYRLPSGDLVASPQQTGEATDAAFSLDGKYLATTGRRNGYVWDTATWSQQHLLVGHEAAIDDVVFTPDDRIVTSSIDSSAIVWDAATGASLNTLSGQSQQKMLAVAVSPDGQQIATVGADPIVRIWTTPLGAIPRALAGHADSVTSVSYSRDGRLLLTASADGTARLWDTTVPVLAPLGAHAGPVSAVAYSSDGKQVLSASADGTAHLWNAGGHGPTLAQGGPVNDATFTSDGRGVLTAGQDGTAKLWSASTGALRATFPHGAPVRAVASSGAVVITGGDDGNVKAWTSAGRLLWTAAQGSPVTALAAGADGTVATGAADGSVRLWRAGDGAAGHVLTGHTGSITSLDFSRDGGRLVSGSADHTARIWDVRTGDLLHPLVGHQFGVTSVDFSPDGKLVATASVDGDAWLWNAATGAEKDKLRFHVSTVSQVAFSPDGRWVVTAGPSAAGLWQTRTGDLVVYLHGAKGNLTSAAWAPDSARIVVGDTGGGVETYRCTVCGRIPALRAQAKTLLREILGPVG